MRTVARGRGGVRNTSGFTQKRQARGGAHLGLHRSHWVPQVGTSQPEVWVVRSVGRSVGWSVGRSVDPSVCVSVGVVGGSIGQLVRWQVMSHVGQSIGRFVRLRRSGAGAAGAVSVAVRIAPAPGATPRASLRFCLPQVGHTSGFTAAARCPRWGHHSEARGVPHPPPSPGYRTHYMTHPGYPGFIVRFQEVDD